MSSLILFIVVTVRNPHHGHRIHLSLQHFIICLTQEDVAAEEGLHRLPSFSLPFPRLFPAAGVGFDIPSVQMCPISQRPF